MFTGDSLAACVFCVRLLTIILSQTVWKVWRLSTNWSTRLKQTLCILVTQWDLQRGMVFLFCLARCIAVFIFLLLVCGCSRCLWFVASRPPHLARGWIRLIVIAIHCKNLITIVANWLQWVLNLMQQRLPILAEFDMATPIHWHNW